jgi:hypothetical protein
MPGDPQPLRGGENEHIKNPLPGRRYAFARVGSRNTEVRGGWSAGRGWGGARTAGDRRLEGRCGLRGETAAHEPAAMSFERGDQRVDVL